MDINIKRKQLCCTCGTTKLRPRDKIVAGRSGEKNKRERLRNET
jgi:hypothetical protein